MQETDRADGGGRCGRGAGLPQGDLKGPEKDMKDGAGGPGPVMEEGPETFGDGKNPLADGQVGDDIVHQVSRGLGHALGVTGRTGSPALAGKRHQDVITAGCASGPGEPMSQDPTPQVAPELSFHVVRHGVAHGIGTVGQGEVGFQVFPNDAVQRGGFGAASPIGLGMGVGRRPG